MTERHRKRTLFWLVLLAPLAAWLAYYGSYIYRSNHAPSGMTELIEVACRADPNRSIQIRTVDGGFARGYSCREARSIPPQEVLWASAIVWQGRPMLLETIVSCDYRAETKVLPVACSTSTNGL